MEIHLRDLTIQFPGMEKPLLHVAERRVGPGSRLLIRGPSGAGKTTLLHIMAGLLDPHGGHAEVDGVHLAKISERRRCRWRQERVGLVFQRLNLLGHLTALENVLLGAFDRSLSREAARASLDRLGMGEHANTPAYHLSLGEQQRVAVARVTARSPLLILADEPTSSLDDRSAHVVITELLAKVKDEGILIVCTHDARVAGHFPQVWSLEEGTIH